MKLKKLFLWIMIIFLLVTGLPSVTYANHWENLDATNIEETSVTLTAALEEDETDPGNYGFQYTTASSDDWTTVSVDKVTSTGDKVEIFADLTRLSADTTYSFRALYMDENFLSELPILGGILDIFVDLEDAHISDKGEFTTLPLKSRELTATPAELSENTLGDNIISLIVNGGTLSSAINEDLVTLNNPPPGTSVGAVERAADNMLHLTLNHDGTDFDTDYADFTITIEEGGFSANGTMTSDAIQVKALTEVEGYNTYTSTGQSFPTEIEMNGYNIREKNLHFNATLQTEMSVESNTATFHYFVGVYDQNGDQIGNAGTYDNPLSVEAEAGSQIIDLSDEVVSLTGTLTPGYRIVVVVKEVTLD